MLKEKGKLRLRNPIGNISFSITGVTPLFKMTVSGLGSENPNDVTFTNNAGSFPTFEEVTIDGNIFIKIPTMYRRINGLDSGQITSFTISNRQVDGSYHPYPCFLEEDGSTVIPYILIGKYACSSSSVANSVDAAVVNMTPSAGRTLCRNKGTGYQMVDWMMHKLWQDLVICGMRTINTNPGTGINVDVVGLSWKNAGSVFFPWVDGVNRVSGNRYVFSYKPSMFVDQATSSTTGYFQSNYTHPTSTSDLCISKLGYDTTHQFLNYPNETVNNSSYNTYYCDYFYPGTSATNPVRCRVGDANAYVGAFGCDTSYDWTDTYGVRLCYRPITQVNPFPFKMTVSGLGSENPDNVGFANDVGVFPTFEEVTIGSDIFIKIPTMYRKVNTVVDNQITSFTISNYQVDGTYSVYPCFLKEDGVTVMPYILIGKYMCSSSDVANSINADISYQPMPTARTLCRAKGAGYQQMDWMIHKLWQDLVICGMKTVNTIPGESQPGIVTDAVGINWCQGTDNPDWPDYQWIDGVNRASGNHWVFSYKPSMFVDEATSSTTGYSQASYTHPSSVECVSKLGYDTSHPFLNYPSGTVNNESYNTYYCDLFYAEDDENNPLAVGFGYGIPENGAFQYDTCYTAQHRYAFRLCYRPV